MLGFVPVPKPVCGLPFTDLNGIEHTCERAAPYWTPWHIHRDHQMWWVLHPIHRLYYHPPKAERLAALATLTHARHQLDRNTIPEDHDELNDAVIKAEKHVLFGKWRGWKYEARTEGIEGVKKKRCPDCGQKKADVTTDRDPFAWELDRTEVDMTACGDCFERRTAEI